MLIIFGVISQLTEHVFGWSLVKNRKTAAFVPLHTPDNGRRNSGSEMLERLLVFTKCFVASFEKTGSLTFGEISVKHLLGY